MIQPLAKLRFVERYCNPRYGWSVFVDIDPSEEGRTGSARQTDEAKARQATAIREAPQILSQLRELGVSVGNRKPSWLSTFGSDIPVPVGDRDIIAVHRDRRLVIVAEVEGDSSGQPEGKIYKALGQLVCALSESRIEGFTNNYALVVWGAKPAGHLKRAAAIARLGVSGLVLGETVADDRWIFGGPVSFP
jgi:hypothetical protein